MQDRIKKHDRDIGLAHTQTSTVSEHANETGHLWSYTKMYVKMCLFLSQCPIIMSVNSAERSHSPWVLLN